MNDISKNMMLWLPAHLVEDQDMVSAVTQGNGLLLDFAEQDISLEQVLDEYSTLGLSPDDFRETLDFNLRQRGA